MVDAAFPDRNPPPSGAYIISTPRVWFHTFGCKANQYDTELIRQELEARGARVVDDPAIAQKAVLNTCTVTSRADAAARRMVRRLHAAHPRLEIVVAGCSSALQAPEYRALPGVRDVVPGHDPMAVAVAAGVEAGLAQTDEEAIGGVLLRSNRRRTRGWLKIQDGCDRKCSFCATRLARGASRSRGVNEIVAEAEVQSRTHGELVLTGIHIGHYGKDLATPGGAEPSLARLCAELLEKVPGVRFRLGSIEATEIEDGLLDLLADSGGALAPHLHIPMQSGSDTVLGRMRRWHTRSAYRRRVLEIARRVRPLGLGADVITGFPGETDADHAATRELVEDLPFTYLHVFPWSPRAGTVAASLDGRVPQRIAAQRARELREIAQRKGAAHASARVGGQARVAVESPAVGLTGDYLRVKLAGGTAGSLINVRLFSGLSGALEGRPATALSLPVVPGGASDPDRG